MKGVFVMKRPTDKEIRLYSRLSDVDGDLILDSALPATMAPPAAKGRGLHGLFLRPQAAAVAIFTILLALTAAALLTVGVFNKSDEEIPPPHGSYPEASGAVKNPLDSGEEEGEGMDAPTDPAVSPSDSQEPTITPSDTGSTTVVPVETKEHFQDTAPPNVMYTPTYEATAALRKGMSLAEMKAVMGENYTVDGDRYTFTLDTGELLTITTAPNEAGESAITGFAWLGEAAKAVNPLNIPADILQKVQEYATDKVIPVYTMDSLLLPYDRRDLPTVDEVLEGAELHYLRVNVDGDGVILDAEGHGMGGNPHCEDYSLLDDVSALFEESVRVKEYYPILTSMERGAVYFQTSIGDYILYFHGNGLSTTVDGSDTPDEIPIYLMPVTEFHKFARGVVEDQSGLPGIEWIFFEERMDAIEPYKIGGESYQKPATPDTHEAAEQVTVGMTRTELTARLGQGLSTGEQREQGIYYWKLNDGRGFFVYCRPDTGAQAGTEPCVTDIVWLDSAELLSSLGRPSCEAVSKLILTGMSQEAVVSLLSKAPAGTHVSSSSSPGVILSTSVWTWEENRKTYTFVVHWDTFFGETKKITVGETTLTEALEPGAKPTPAMAEKVTVGMRDNAALSQMSGTPTMTKVFGNGILYVWELSDGRFFGVVMENRTSSEAQLFSLSVAYTFYRDSLEEISAPTPENMEAITEDMSALTIFALLGEPTEQTSRIGTLLWVTPESIWWEIEIEFEIVITGSDHGTLNIEYLYVKSITLLRDSE